MRLDDSFEANASVQSMKPGGSAAAAVSRIGSKGRRRGSIPHRQMSPISIPIVSVSIMIVSIMIASVVVVSVMIVVVIMSVVIVIGSLRKPLFEGRGLFHHQLR